MLSEREDKLAHLAVEKRYLTHNQLTDCVAFKRDHAPSVPLDHVFIERGYLTFEEVEELLRQSADAPLFASLLREQGLVTDAQVRAALRQKHELASRNIHRFLGEILVERGLISHAQVESTLARQGKLTQVCKACGYRYNAPHGFGYACPECNRPISATQVRVADNRVGDYVRKEELGRGSLGRVYRAVHPERGLEAALRIIPGDRYPRPYLERCLARARDLSLIHHANLAAVLDSGTRGDSIYIAAQFVEGLTLREHVTGSIRLAVAEAVGVLKQVAAGLEAAHARGLVHGNLTPENVFITELREVRLTDLGLARELRGLPAGELREMKRTLPYLAPERWNGRAAPSADLYACGALWYFMLTGTQPFQGASVEETRRLHCERDPVPLLRKVPNLPREADALFAALTRKDPAQRIPHAAQLITELDRMDVAGGVPLEEEDSPPPLSPPPRRLPPRHRRRRQI